MLFVIRLFEILDVSPNYCVQRRWVKAFANFFFDWVQLLSRENFDESQVRENGISLGQISSLSLKNKVLIFS